MRRPRADLLEVFKILNGMESLEIDRFFKLATSDRTRGHSKKLLKCHSRLNVRLNSFSQRVINPWNTLTEEMIKSASVNEFKNKIRPMLENHRDLVKSQKWLPVPVPTVSGSLRRH